MSENGAKPAPGADSGARPKSRPGTALPGSRHLRLPLEAGFHTILQLNAIATLLGASVFCALLWGEAPQDLLIGWWLLMALSAVMMLVDRYIYMRRHRLRWWLAYDIFTASFCGLAWGSAAIGMPMLEHDARMLVVAVIAGVMGFSAPALSIVPLAGTLFLIGVAAPFAVYFTTLGTTIGYGLAGLLFGYVAMMLSTNYTLNRILNRNRQLGEENTALYDRIRDAQQELLGIADSSEAFVFFDEVGRIQLWNRRLPALLGIDEDQLRRDAALPPLLSTAGLPAGLLTRLEMAGSGSPRPVLQLANGRWVRASLRRTPQGDRALILVDITEQQQASARLREQNERLEELFHQVSEARDAALRASHAKSTFLANMSHELRTPLNAIIGFSDIIRQKMFGPDSPKYGEYVDDIHGSGRHLLGIIDDILDLARIEANQISLNETPVAIAEEAATCIRLAGQQFGRPAASMLTSLPDGLPDLLADARLLRQILLNLIGNAVKFSPAGAPIEIGALCNPAGEIELWVRDHGIGIAEADQARIFEPFEQADSQLSRKFGGLGLGLSLVRAFVAAHGGRIAVDSRPGQGSRISAIFPAVRTRPVA
ncbi:sensor histidine kinase [Ferrovibrio sp.]|uniref:sensor histidine kinase n=1 Tax=Ferrovibrio sp. TaxID=1917215 RepID=UPI0035115B55